MAEQQGAGTAQRQDEELERGMRLGKFIVLDVIGTGRGGGKVYSAIESTQQLANGMLSLVRPTCVVKYPVRDQKEVETMRTLMRLKCPGVPNILDSGLHKTKVWFAMDILGRPFHEIADLPRIPSQLRWQLIQVLGRLLLRRLQAMHARGFVHCDVQPENILMSAPDNYSLSQDLGTPFFIDFGSAQRHPHGPPVPSHWVTLEFSSIRTAEGSFRAPIDDVESLGWVLCYFAGGDLPWFSNIKSVDWDNKEQRAKLILQVQETKLKHLKGTPSLEEEVPDVPRQLVEYLRLCQTCAPNGPLDYVAFYKFLGWSNETSDSLAEVWDQTIFRRLCEAAASSAPETSDPYALARKDFFRVEQEHQAVNARYFVSGSWSNWVMQRMTQDRSEPGVHCLELHLPQDGGSFQIARNRDLNLVFYPTCKNARGSKATPILGPDANSDGFQWDILGEAGDIFMIKFAPAKVPESGISIQKMVNKPLPPSVLATLPVSKYFVVGSWDKWKNMHNMTCFGSRHVFSAILGNRGLESFQIVCNRDWNQRLHPNVKDANPFVAHQLDGPERKGAGYNWKIGHHPLDWAGPGSHIQIQLLTQNEIPMKVEWRRA